MTFRSRLVVAFVAGVLIPMITLAFFVRAEMTKRLTAQYERRVNALARVLEGDLVKESRSIAAALSVIRGAAANDNRFREAAVGGDASVRRYLLDYAGNAMTLTGLDYLQIQDAGGRILSSGHFRNEYDRLEPGLPQAIASTPEGFALVSARAPDEPFLALAGVDSFRLGGNRFTVVAGVKVGEEFLARLARDDELGVDLLLPAGKITSRPAAAGSDSASTEIARELRVPFVDEGDVYTARFRVSHATTELDALRSSVDRWFLASVAVAAILALLLGSWLASRISRPLSELAEKTARLDLDRLDVDFSSRRRDEIGRLSRLLGAMTARLRSSAQHIRDAERRATLGDVARQVNHDIKNGLTPLRNVIRHVADLARTRPEEVAEVFTERQKTLDASMSYLEKLATNYARLSPKTVRQRCNVNVVAHGVVANLEGMGDVRFVEGLRDGAFVMGDLVSVRRILENLISNAAESLPDDRGTVRIETQRVDTEEGARVKIVITDDGVGMTEGERRRVFEDFYTTKESGTGLGLSIVRRLVMDLDGTVHVESEVGTGTKFVVDLPAADA